MKRASGRTALQFNNISKSYGVDPVIRSFSAIVARGEKVILMGRNGVGKTTLLRALLAAAAGQEESDFDIDSGAVEWGHEVQAGYFPQDHRASIAKGMTAFDWLHQWDPQASRDEIRGLLGQMLFSGDEGLKPTDALSGGEAARLLLCKLMLQKPNVLVFDEPTNHLDLESINALSLAIRKYEGTVLLVTHDEDLIDESATRLWHFENDTIEDFKGSYADYLIAAPRDSLVR
jgi:ATPase subunit of ABC transporter with duplicated ATPase domains